MRSFSFLLAIFIFSCSLYIAQSEFSWKCLGCEAGVEVLHFLYQQNATVKEILKAANFVCRHFADQDSFVCRGIMSQFRDEFVYVLGRLVFWPSQLCGLLLRDCGTPIDPFDTNWTVPLPPKTSHTPPPLHYQRFSHSPLPPIRILQLSDIHFDPAYLEGSEAQCIEPICCLEHIDRPKKKAGYWGTASKCDIPLRTIENMFEHINRTHKFDFAFLSGDYIHHRDWAYTRKEHRNSIVTISNLIQKYLPHVPVFWTLGNHEGVPVNAFAPHFVPAKFRPEWMYRTLLREGHKTAMDKLPPSVDQSAIYRGSYTVELAPGLKLISLNNGYCDKTNMFIYINQTDPDGSLTWLVEELWEAEKSGQSVYILAHIPPGDDECLESWSRNYYRIVIRFADTIGAQFFGHTHYDSFSLFFSDMNNPQSKPISMLHTAPSVTTFEYLNPAYRIYIVDQSNWELLDHENYFLNLSAFAQNDNDKPKWEFLYSAKLEYGLKDMSVKEWANLVEKIKTSPEIAMKFNRNFVRRNDIPCDEKCMDKRICSIMASHHNEKALCGRAMGEKEVRQPENERKSGKREKRRFARMIKNVIWRKMNKWIKEKKL